MGIYSSVKWDSSSFTYTKSTTGDGPVVNDWDNYGESFEPYLTPLTSQTMPLVYNLEQNRPNPFNPVTTISYQLADKGLVSLKVYDLGGRLVGTLVNAVQEAGQHSVSFDGSRLSSGMYFVRMQAGNFTSVRKMVLLK